MTGGPLREWLGTADATSTWTASVCTGALILAGAGLLTGRAAATHWLAKDELARLGAAT
jgi:transcriptional regulator GlxA family with amidase domain